MARILVTGASGLLGANCVLAAMDRGHRVLAACHAHPIAGSSIESVVADLADTDACDALVRESRADWILHCAALTDVDGCERNPEAARAVHVEATRAIAETARACGMGMVCVSTDAVYPGEKGPYSETDATLPRSVYAATKLEGEQAALAAHSEALVVRTTIYGWNAQNKRSLAEWALEELEAGRMIRGFTDAVFSPILTNDLAETLLEAVERRLQGVYNVGSREACSKYEFLTRLAATFGLDPVRVVPGLLVEASFIAPRPRDVSMNVRKIEQAFGRPMPSVDEGLARFRRLRESGYVDRLKALSGRQP